MSRLPQPMSPRQRERADEAARFGVRRVGEPSVGFYRLRLVKMGPFVGARIFHEPTADPDFPDNEMARSPHWYGEIDGTPDPEPGPSPSDAVWRIHERGERIDEAEYRWLLAEAEWCRDFGPEEPIANPRRPIDLSKMEPLI